MFKKWFDLSKTKNSTSGPQLLKSNPCVFISREVPFHEETQLNMYFLHDPILIKTCYQRIAQGKEKNLWATQRQNCMLSAGIKPVGMLLSNIQI